MLHKMLYRLLRAWYLQESNCNKYFIVVFNKFSKRQVNSYELMNKINLTGNAVKSVTGNGWRSFSVEGVRADQRRNL